jgi:hypothetical protein
MEPDLTEADCNWLAALGLLEVSRRFETGKLIRWPSKKTPSRSQSQFLKLIAADHTPGC